MADREASEVSNAATDACEEATVGRGLMITSAERLSAFVKKQKALSSADL